MGSQSEAALLLGLLISLTASSFCVALIANNYSTNPPCPMGSECGPITLSYTGITAPAVWTTEDYTNTSGYNSTLIGSPSQWGVDYGEWTQGAGGMVLTASSTDLQSGEPTVYLKNVVPLNGQYSVYYTVDNVPNEWFDIYARKSQRDLAVYDIKIHFDQEGIHVRDNVGLGGDLMFWPYENAQTTLPGGSSIRVDYNTNTNVLQVVKDGGAVYALSGVYPLNGVTGEMYYAAVSSNSVGFALKGSSTQRSLTPDTANDGSYSLASIWAGVIQMVDGVIPGAGAVIQMVTIFGQVIVWTLPEEIMPLWLNMILIKTQAIAVIYLGARLARGGG